MKTDRKAQLLKEFEAKIAEVNKVVGKGTNAEVEGKLAELANIEKEYRAIREKEVFASCADIHEALVMHSFEVIAHKKVTEEGLMVGVEKSTKTVQIDLRKFCEYKNFSLEWFYEMQALNKRLTLKAATELGMTAKEIKEIDDSYNMDKLAAEIDLGKTPTSDTQVVKHIQKVLDTLSPDEGRVNGHDLAYIWLCYGKKDKKAALRVVCSKHTILQSLLMDVFHRVATNGVYGLSYKKNGAVNEVKETKTEKKPKAKAEKKVPEAETVVVKREEAAA